MQRGISFGRFFSAFLGGLNEPMQAQYFFFLGITDSKNQVILLQKFMKLLQDQEFVAGLTNISAENEMFEFLQREFDK